MEKVAEICVHTLRQKSFRRQMLFVNVGNAAYKIHGNHPKKPKNINKDPGEN